MLTEKDLSSHLTHKGVPHRILDPGEPTPTCEAAAKALGVNVDQIIKSLLFTTDRDDRVLLVLRGDVRADARKVETATGTRGWRLATPEEVQTHTGYPVGAVPPFLVNDADITVLVDPLVTRETTVIGGGGSGHLLLECASRAIVDHNPARVVDVTKT